MKPWTDSKHSTLVNGYRLLGRTFHQAPKHTSVHLQHTVGIERVTDQHKGHTEAHKANKHHTWEG